MDPQAVVMILLGIYRLLLEKRRRDEEMDQEEEEEMEATIRCLRKMAAERRRRANILLAYKYSLRRQQQLMFQMKAFLCRRKPPLSWSRVKSTEWWETIVTTFTPDEWLNNFRMSKETFEFLCDKVGPTMMRRDTTFRMCVPVPKRVAIALWKLATTSEYRSIAHLFGVGITTVWRCVSEFCAAVNESLLADLVGFPDEAKMAEMAQYFEQRWGLPHCVGTIGVSHVRIMAPRESPADYLNRKGWHSIGLQAVVDGEGLFWDVSAGSPGSIHDARVLRLSRIWQSGTNGHFTPLLQRAIGGQNMGFYLLGDDAYPLQPWLVKPFADTGLLTAEQQTFNSKVSMARSVVENAFGRLKGRWRCLMKRIDCQLELVTRMTATCCVLHNLCESRGEVFRQEWYCPTPLEPIQQAHQDVEAEGTHVRNALMRHFVSL